jgi:hypothetical protein
MFVTALRMVPRCPAELAVPDILVVAAFSVACPNAVHVSMYSLRFRTLLFNLYTFQVFYLQCPVFFRNSVAARLLLLCCLMQIARYLRAGNLHRT